MCNLTVDAGYSGTGGADISPAVMFDSDDGRPQEAKVVPHDVRKVLSRMTSIPIEEITAEERRRHDAAVDQFTDLLARLIAREHLRRSADEEAEKNKSKDEEE